MVVGGDAGGMAAISQARKGKPDLEVIAFERGRWTSYSACGIPYLVGGEVDGVDRLVARTPERFRADGIDVRMRQEVVAIHLDERQVEVRDLERERTYREAFDQLLIGTGGVPVRPPLPGIDLPLVHGVQTLDDGIDLLDHAEEVAASRLVVVGGGYIGLEMAEAFVQRGASVVVVERGPHLMGATLDADMAALVGTALERFGAELRLGCEVTGFADNAVETADGPIEADLVVLGIGVGPNSKLAEEAGLELGVKRAIRVDRRQRTSADGVWAAGDCCESTHLVSGRPVHVALGTVANKQARVAGLNIGGGYATFPGVLGTAISKICSTEVARTGLTRAEAEQAGFEVLTTTIETTTRAGYFPGAEPMTLRFTVERGRGRLLGAQIVGGAGAAKRIDTCAVAITAAMTVHDIVDLDLAYAPPFSGVWDPVLVAAREAIKVL